MKFRKGICKIVELGIMEVEVIIGRGYGKRWIEIERVERVKGEVICRL